MAGDRPSKKPITTSSLAAHTSQVVIKRHGHGSIFKARMGYGRFHAEELNSDEHGEDMVRHPSRNMKDKYLVEKVAYNVTAVLVGEVSDINPRRVSGEGVHA